MCDTDEHMLIGDTAAAWLPQMLQTILETAKRNQQSVRDRAAEWDAIVVISESSAQSQDGKINTQSLFGQGGRFTNYNTGQFKYGPNPFEDASYGDIIALSGDYYSNETAFKAAFDDVDKLRQEFHKKLKRPEDTIVVDPVEAMMMERAYRNWPHFGFDAIEMWLKTHREAIQIAIDGRNNAVFDEEDISVKRTGWNPTVSSLMLALRHNAFGDHYLSDLFSSAHMRLARGSVYDYLNSSQKTREPSQSTWQLPGVTDVASVLARVAHQEDGNMGLWCRLAFGDCTLPGIEGATAISGQCPDPDTESGTMETNWPAPVAKDIGQFFALGDDLLMHANNTDTRELCFYCIGLSIRDILIASVTGDDPTAYPGYWDAAGGKPSPAPLYAPLRLVPRPKEAQSGSGTVTSNFDRQSNHYPFFRPDYEMAGYYDNLKLQMSGLSFELPASFTLRSVAHRMAFSAVMPVEEGPLTKGCDYDIQSGNDYFDLRDYLNNGDPAIPSIPAFAWREREYQRLIRKMGGAEGASYLTGKREEWVNRPIAKQLELQRQTSDALRATAKQLEDAAAGPSDEVLKKVQDLRTRADQLAEQAKSQAGKVKAFLETKGQELKGKADALELDVKNAAVKKAQELNDRARQIEEAAKRNAEEVKQSVLAKKAEYESAANASAGAIQKGFERKAADLAAVLGSSTTAFEAVFRSAVATPSPLASHQTRVQRPARRRQASALKQ